MNKIIISGRLTKDGELRTTDSGKTVYSGSVAVNRKYKKEDGTYDADFFNFVYWNCNEKFAEYLKKGKQILVEGSLQTRTYEDKEKNKKYVVEIVAERIELIGEGKKEEKVEVPQNTTTKYEEHEIELSDADLPF